MTVTTKHLARLIASSLLLLILNHLSQ